MQQKYLEEQIGAHRKSKKALSAKQRTAKKAGREFPEEDAEQLKHVTEQQSMVQKQLEQVTQSLLAINHEWIWLVVSGTQKCAVRNDSSQTSSWGRDCPSPCPRVMVTQHALPQALLTSCRVPALT